MITLEIFDDDSLCRLTTEEDGVKYKKYIKQESLAQMFYNSVSLKKSKDEVIYCSQILPNDKLVTTIQVKACSNGAVWYVMQREPESVNLTYHSRTAIGYSTKDGNILYKNVAIPKIIFAVKVFNDKCTTARIVALKGDTENITNDTDLYKWPYSNVYGNGRICWGNNMIGNYRISETGTIGIAYLMEMFFAMPGNDDGYYGANNSCLMQSELLEVMSGAKFDDDILIKSLKYGDFIKTLD